MTTVDRDQLIKTRLQKAAKLAVFLRNEIDDLKRRLALVEIHNEELQELFEKLSVDQLAIESSIEASFNSADATVEEGSINDNENKEIEDVEDIFSSDDEDLDSFFGDDEDLM